MKASGVCVLVKYGIIVLVGSRILFFWLFTEHDRDSCHDTLINYGGFMSYNREEIIADICEGTVDNFCNLLEQHKIQDVVPMIDQAIDDIADCIMEGDDE